MTQLHQFVGESVKYRFDRFKNMIVSGLNLGQVEKVSAAPATPAVLPWFSLTQLTTQAGPPYDISNDAGDLPQLESDGLVLQNVRGLEIPTGLAGTSPDGLWQLGDQSLADIYASNTAPIIPMDLRVSMFVHKPVHTSAIAGKRMIGWFKQDQTAYLAAGLVGSTYRVELFVNGTLYVSSFPTAATGQPRYIRGFLVSSGTEHVKPSGAGYDLPANAFNLGDPFAHAGGTTTGSVAPNQAVYADLRAAIGNGDDWFPCLWIDSYDQNDDPVAFAYVEM